MVSVGAVEPTLVVRLFAAIGIGALVGIERERSESAGTIAGSRTFPLIALLGALTATFVPSALPVVAAAVGTVVAIGYAGKAVLTGDVGLTTAVTAMLVFVYGVMTTHSDTGFTLAVVLGVVTTSVLAAKGPLHAFANTLEREELRATLEFLIVALVVAPLLPNREIDQLLGLNPRFVWLMVVFVSGISLLAYVLTRYLGPERGIGLTGVLGGFVSSTATAVSMANRSAEDPDLGTICGFAVVAASTTMFPRALLEIAVVNPALVWSAAVPLGAMTAVGAVGAVVVLWRSYADEALSVDLDNPFRLQPALLFGLFFAVVLVVSERVGIRYGATGVYVTAFVSGLADVDAMTLSLSRLAVDGTVSNDVATTGIVIAAIANTIVKAGIAWVFGTRRLAKLVTAVLGAATLVGLAVTIVL